MVQRDGRSAVLHDWGDDGELHGAIKEEGMAKSSNQTRSASSSSRSAVDRFSTLIHLDMVSCIQHTAVRLREHLFLSRPRPLPSQVRPPAPIPPANDQHKTPDDASADISRVVVRLRARVSACSVSNKVSIQKYLRPESPPPAGEILVVFCRRAARAALFSDQSHNRD